MQWECNRALTRARWPVACYSRLPRPSLPVSPLALGTMTSGTKRWGSPG